MTIKSILEGFIGKMITVYLYNQQLVERDNSEYYDYLPVDINGKFELTTDENYLENHLILHTTILDVDQECDNDDWDSIPSWCFVINIDGKSYKVPIQEQ